MRAKVYLSGEIHSNWRDNIISGAKKENLNLDFLSPETNHKESDDCGPNLLGAEEKKFWHDFKSAKINAIKIKNSIDSADLVIIFFGEKYKQWNTAFDAGYAAALGKSLIVIHRDEHQHALKEIDACANAVAKNTSEVINILSYLFKKN